MSDRTAAGGPAGHAAFAADDDEGYPDAMLKWIAIMALLFGPLACGDEVRRAVDGEVISDVADTAAPTPDADHICRATLTEVDRGFVEVLAVGDCADWSVAIRDGANAACQLAAEVFLPR